MSIRQSILGEVAIRNGADVTGADVDGLLRRLLLFDSTIINSVRLREIPFLVRAFGKHGFLELLQSKILSITCEFHTIVSPLSRNGVRVHPLCTFSFGHADISGRDKVLRDGLIGLQGVPGLKNREREEIENYVLGNLLRPPAEFPTQLLGQVEADIRQATPAFEFAVKESLRRTYGENIPQVNLKVTETSERTFFVQNDISRVLGVSEESADKILSNATTVVGHLNRRIADMVTYSAITGFSESESPILFGKLSGIIKTLNPAPAEEQFSRVATLADFPTLTPGRRIDAARLLDVRNSLELKEFRAWISDPSGLTDVQIRDMVGGVRNRAGQLIKSETGKALRFIATTAIGAALPVVGVAVGIFDAFLLEKLFPSSGIFAFLNKSYPSLFVPEGGG